MTGVVGAAAVPTAPLLVPGASPGQPEDVRDEVERLRELSLDTLAGLPDSDAYVLVARGERGIHDRAAASLAPLGVPGLEVELSVATELIEGLSRLTQYPMYRGDPLSIAHSVLVMLLRDARGEVPVLPVNVPAAGDFDVLVAVGASVAEAAEDAERTVSVVCQSDLSAALDEASPGYAVEGARAWDDAVLEAVRERRLRRLEELGPDEAQRVEALGWAPLAVLHGVCASGHLQVEGLGYGAPRGVGQLVARCRDQAPGDTDRFQIVRPEDPHGGVVPRTGDPRG